MAPSPLFASDDARILDRIRKGDEGALADLYRENRKPVRALVTRNSGSEDDADDMLDDLKLTVGTGLSLRLLPEVVVLE